MANAVAEYLTEFRLDGTKVVKPLLQPKALKSHPEERKDKIVAQIYDAERRGHAQGREAARQEFELALDSERKDFEQRLEAERRKWVQQETAKFASQLVEAIASLETRLVNCVARILAPLVTEALRTQMLNELRDVLVRLVSHQQSITIQVRGPEDMLSALSHQLGEQLMSVELVPSDSADVSIVMNDTAIDSQLSAWAMRIDQAVQPS